MLPEMQFTHRPFMLLIVHYFQICKEKKSPSFDPEQRFVMPYEISYVQACFLLHFEELTTFTHPIGILTQ